MSMARGDSSSMVTRRRGDAVVFCCFLMGELGPEEMPDRGGADWRLLVPSKCSAATVGRVMKSPPLHFEVRQSRSYRLRAMKVGSPWWWFYMERCAAKKERANSRIRSERKSLEL